MKSSIVRLAAFGTVAVLASAVTLLAVRARAAGIPEADGMVYTGYLESSDATPLTGDHSIAVKFWESEDAEDALCIGQLDTVELQSGRFQVPLPLSCSEAVQAAPDVWISVDVDGASLGRTKLGAVPYALEAGHASEAAHAATAEAAVSADSTLVVDTSDASSTSRVLKEVTFIANNENKGRSAPVQLGGYEYGKVPADAQILGVRVASGLRDGCSIVPTIDFTHQNASQRILLSITGFSHQACADVGAITLKYVYLQ